jgi:murein DD-endopeptidase MepM/ murein hydrolase activator NlpD
MVFLVCTLLLLAERAETNPGEEESPSSTGQAGVALQERRMVAFHERLHREALAAQSVTVAPVDTACRLGSRFGWRRSRRTGRRIFHRGLDYAAPRGSSVHAVQAGTVFDIARDVRGRNGYRGYGNAVVLYHDDQEVWSFYAHLSQVTVEPGQRVSAGQLVGRVGATNNGLFPGMGAHLHFEIRHRTPQGAAPFPGAYGAYNLDPQKWLAQQGVHYDRRGFLVLDQGPPAVAAASGRGPAVSPQSTPTTEAHGHDHSDDDPSI